MKIHPLAVVSSRARIGTDVEIGPFCIIEPNTTIGDNCKLESRVVVKEGTTLGDNNHVFEGAVLGGLPQHVDIPEEPGDVVIGSGNVIREAATVHRALHAGTSTTIGDDNMLMVNAHIAHDCRIGNNAIVANNVLLSGHVTIGDRAILSGAVAIHQFCRIGTLAMVGGQGHLTRDVPPFMLVDGLTSQIVGLNRVGLRRAGYPAEDVSQLKKAYRMVYREGLAWTDLLAKLEAEFTEGPALEMTRFLAGTTRGLQPERRAAQDAETLRQALAREKNDEDGEPPLLKVHAG